MTNDFARLGVPTALLPALQKRGITSPTPIQQATLPDSLAGRDVLGRGRTGSGKTYAFLLPLVARLADGRRPAPKTARSLVLAPTRELASQIEESLLVLAEATGLTHTTIFGGVNQNPQVRAMARGVDILIACPGRLLDLVGQHAVDLSKIEITVIDEADHMADMGFLPMVRRVLDQTPKVGQRMLFSATLDAGVGVLVKTYLTNPVSHEADSAVSPVAAMDHHVLSINSTDRVKVLAELAAAPGKTIVFTRTKHGAKKLTKQLLQQGVPAVDLHGNLAQNARTRNLDAFHSGRVETLVATDIAARGIHVDDVELVVHADPPTEHKAYLHRSGRTARAGKAGTVLTLMLPEQQGEVRSLMRAAKIKPTMAVATAGAAVLRDLAPGERVYVTPEIAEATAYPNKVEPGHNQSGQGRSGSGRSGSGRSGSGRSGSARSGSGRSGSGRRLSGRSGTGSSDNSGQQGNGGARAQRASSHSARSGGPSTSRNPGHAPSGRPGARNGGAGAQAQSSQRRGASASRGRRPGRSTAAT